MKNLTRKRHLKKLQKRTERKRRNMYLAMNDKGKEKALQKRMYEAYMLSLQEKEKKQMFEKAINQ